jgi:hypothetical protein
MDERKAIGLVDRFSPFACETYGGLHQTAEDVIDRVAELATENIALFPSSQLRRSLLDSVSINIQRGNALIMTKAGVRHMTSARAG